MLTEKIKRDFYLVNILGLDAAVMIEGKIAEDGGTAQLLSFPPSPIQHTSY